MSLVLDPNKPWSSDEKDWARNCGRGHLIAANERRFGADGTREPDEGEAAGSHPESALYSNDIREAAVYDVGGASLPGATLDYDTGRAYAIDGDNNGVLVEPNLPTNAPGAYATEVDGVFGSVSDAGDDVDEDIVEYVLGLKTKKNVTDAIDEFNAKHEGEVDLVIAYTKADDRYVLNDKLALGLQDERYPEQAAEARLAAAAAQPAVIEADEDAEDLDGLEDESDSDSSE